VGDHRLKMIRDMSCKTTGNSVDLLRSPTFINKMRTYGEIGIRYHEMPTRENGDHYDYTLGWKGIRAVVDFIIPKMLPNPRVLQAKSTPIEAFFPPSGQKVVLLFMECHDPSYMFDEEGVWDDPKRGKEPWHKVYGGKAQVTMTSEFAWVLTVGPTTSYKIWKPNFADFRTNVGKAWIQMASVDGCMD